ncbi:hypothetical protein F0562_015336 [Nyssa sinensis]|uniref:Uncharacterized protein n=1 Tax=Nyssa sinensis TaxID=561372 RepID=A0A5J4ZH20_9ASTE|nr:hypothetical protein F0562_015336 [Nyssa sinensis]
MEALVRDDDRGCRCRCGSVVEEVERFGWVFGVAGVDGGDDDDGLQWVMRRWSERAGGGGDGGAVAGSVGGGAATVRLGCGGVGYGDEGFGGWSWRVMGCGR